MTSRILGPDGHPIALESVPSRRSMMTGNLGTMNSYAAGLTRSRMPARQRVGDPFSNHSWVFACAQVTAIVASQAPFGVMRETPQYQTFLDLFAKARGSANIPRFGRQRRAMQRHSTISSYARAVSKDIEPDLEHPLSAVLAHPNPLQSSTALIQLTVLWLALRGESFWVKTGPEGLSPTEDGAPVENLWCFGPDCFYPQLEHYSYGPLVGWWFAPPQFMRQGNTGAHIFLPLGDVIQFKYPDPMNPLRGMSRITAVASSIESDLMARDYNRSTMENGGDPGGILTYPDTLSEAEEKDYRARWEQRHKGEQNRNKTAILSGGLTYQPISLSPRDMQFLEMLRWDREEVLAVMGVPPSVLGLTQFTNYATQLGQDKNFLDKRLMPDYRLIEATVDENEMAQQPDTTCCLFDLRQVEALRAGTAERVAVVNQLTSPQIHMPPRTAFEVAGLLDIPSYPEDTTVLLGNQKLQDALNPPPPPEIPVGTTPGQDTDKPVPPGFKARREFNEDQPRTDDGRFGTVEDHDYADGADDKWPDEGKISKDWDSVQSGISAEVEKWQSSLNEEDRALLEEYTDNSVEINEALWSKPSESNREEYDTAKEISRVLKSAPNFKGTVYRAVGLSDEQIDDFEGLVGDSVTMKGFTSVSIDEKLAKRFTGDESESKPWARNVLFEIEARRAKIVEGVASRDVSFNAKEAILDKRSTLEIMSVDRSNPNAVRIKLREYRDG